MRFPKVPRKALKTLGEALSLMDEVGGRCVDLSSRLWKLIRVVPLCCGETVKYIQEADLNACDADLSR